MFKGSECKINVTTTITNKLTENQQETLGQKPNSPMSRSLGYQDFFEKKMEEEKMEDTKGKMSGLYRA
jgi:hypothetical protein